MSLKNKISYIFTKKQKTQLVFLFMALFIGAVLELLGVSLLMPLVNVITEPEKVQQNNMLNFVYELFNIQSINEFFALLVLSLIVLYIVKNIYMVGMYYLQYTFVFDNQLNLSSTLIDCYLKKPYTYHLDKNTSEMVRNIMLDTERFFQMLLSILSLMSELLISTLLCIYLLVLDPEITILVAIVLGVCSMGYLFIIRNKVKVYGKENQKYDGKMHQAISQALGAVKDIKILHREKYFVDSFRGYGKRKMHAVKNSNLLGQVPKYLMEAASISSLLIALLLKLRSGTELSSLIPQLTVFAAAAFKLLPSISKISNYLNLIIFLKPSIDLIYRDLKETEDMLGQEFVQDSLNGIASGKTVERAASISIKGVSYTYPKSSEVVINDASFEIPVGASVGLVGPSGSGKSTMADLILGILMPSQGGVYYGKMNVHKYPLEWSKKLAYIPQAIYLADETIRSNIAFGIEEADIDEEKVWAALGEAQLKEFVLSLEKGLDTVVGERGVRLSGGQRQRIGIARALYDNPEILVLDEATSALDNETERAVMEAIDKLHGKKTLIIIAHRLTTIKNCELIYRVENGKVIEVSGEDLQK